MTQATSDVGRVTDEKRQYWNKVFAAQAASGETVRAFCKARGIGLNTFYLWRRRLEPSEPVEFALLETVASPSCGGVLELVMGNGELLRIPHDVDAATLRLVLDAIRR